MLPICGFYRFDELASVLDAFLCESAVSSDNYKRLYASAAVKGLRASEKRGATPTQSSEISHRNARVERDEVRFLGRGRHSVQRASVHAQAERSAGRVRDAISSRLLGVVATVVNCMYTNRPCVHSMKTPSSASSSSSASAL